MELELGRPPINTQRSGASNAFSGSLSRVSVAPSTASGGPPTGDPTSQLRGALISSSSFCAAESTVPSVPPNTTIWVYSLPENATGRPSAPVVTLGYQRPSGMFVGTDD